MTTAGPRQDVMLAQLERLVSIESPSDDVRAVRACMDAVADLGEQLVGRAPQVVERGSRPHLLWRPDRPRVLLLGHVDTVWPRGTLDRWPFAVDGETATGPGVFDMKAGIVVGLHALAAAAAGEHVAVLLTSDEEVGSTTSRGLIEETARDLDAVLVLEPGLGDAVKVARKGVSTYTLEVTGRAAHAGLEPERGANALLALAGLVRDVDGLSRPDVGTTVTPTVARAGTTQNTVPADAWCHVDVRAETADEQDRVDAAIRGLRADVAGARVHVAGGVNRPPLPRSAAEGLYARLAAAAERIGVATPEGVGVGGGSDGNFTAALGVPTLDGLGAVGAGAHAEGEHVVVSSLPARARLLTALLDDLLAG